jgi:hypothetical protein
MNLNVRSYNQQFRDTGKLVLDSDVANNHPMNKFGVRLVEADVAPGETYWKVIGIHHLSPTENRGDHHIYLEALDEAGVRIHAPLVWATSQFGSITEPVKLEKPDAEPAGNIPMYEGNTYKASIRGLSLNASDKSDRVDNIHTNHPDEPLPADGLGGVTNGHHSFYVVFQRTKKGAADPNPQPVNFLQYAVDHGLGNAVTPKFEFEQHQVQVFVLGVVFAKNVQPNAIQHQLW